ncbi:hypothetical protein PANT_22d00203 [Moesziomyces antarcticus T-34]|uniref:Uncharacterized protein n=1 Tax=Pseudozyma antarctica (strain T-34) TaxID=1151754 RepID=M9MG74_PSEA3|nr:hypothetical protein PANT_22d00203 [Moesziomyces antarcticus T-34]
MSRGQQHAQAGPSDARRSRPQPQHAQQNSSAAPSWTMLLFGGRSASTASQSSARPRSDRSFLGWGKPSGSSSGRRSEERESLIGATASEGDAFDDSDAISLLSNIADRDSRRGGSAAARRRARARARAHDRTCGTVWFDLEDWGRAMSCGLFGRGNRDANDSGRQRAASIGSVMSRGARRSNHASSSGSVVATSRHSRSLSDASTDSGASLSGPGFAESIDEDAGMLDDQAIARFGRSEGASTSDEERQRGSPAEAQTKAEAEAELKAKAEAEARAQAEAEEQAKAERQKALDEEAARLKKEAEEESERQKQEEARLAAAEEAAIAKARRKAERKAAKAGLLKLQQETHAAQRWRTEAEAEAAAGGFSFAESDADQRMAEGDEPQAYAQQQYGYDGGFEDERGMHEGEYDQYGDAEEPEGYYTVEERGPGGVVHHHHYYHAPPTGYTEGDQYSLSTEFAPAAGAFIPDVSAAEPDVSHEKPQSEDEADIAGLSFGRKKGPRRGDSGSASGSRSGSGLTPRAVPTAGGSSSGGSANGLRAPLSASSSTGRPGYRDRPRRHERTSSKSSNSSSGLRSFASSALHAPPSTAATSVAPAMALPNLYESEPLYAPDEGAGDVPAGQFGSPHVDANEFGVITAGTNRGGAGRVKKANREQRHSKHEPDADFDGFPAF